MPRPDNAVEAVWRAATRPLPRAVNTYNVSNGEPRELIDVLTVMAGEFGLPLRTRKVPWPLVELVARSLETFADTGGRPLGMNFDADGNLIVADA